MGQTNGRKDKVSTRDAVAVKSKNQESINELINQKGNIESGFVNPLKKKGFHVQKKGKMKKQQHGHYRQLMHYMTIQVKF